MNRGAARKYIAIAIAIALVLGFTIGYNVAALQHFDRAREAERPSLPRLGVESPMREESDRARRASGGFLDDIDDRTWAMYERRHASQMAKQAIAGGGSERPGRVWYQNNWEPSFSCQHERRIGRMGDGGKWICDPHRIGRRVDAELRRPESGKSRGCLIYSVGSDNDFSFEESVREEISPACEVHTFDPSIGAAPSNQPQWVAFHPWGVSSSSGAVAGTAHDGERNAAMRTGVFMTLTEISAALGHSEREIDVLKIDCESCEWGAFETWFGPGAPTIRQVLIELHEGTHSYSKAKPVADDFFRFMRSKGYAVFHKEPNTLGCGCVRPSSRVVCPASPHAPISSSASFLFHSALTHPSPLSVPPGLRRGDCIEYSFLRVDIEASPPPFVRAPRRAQHAVALGPREALLAAACAVAAKKYGVITEVTWGSLPRFSLRARSDFHGNGGALVVDTRRKWSTAKCNDYAR